MRSRRRAWLVAVIASVSVLAVSGCGALAPSGYGVVPSDAAPAVSATPATSSPGGGSSAAPTAATGGKVIVDPALLDRLPGTVAGIPLEPDPETAAAIAADPSLGDTASALAVARAVSGTEQDDLLVASVVRLRPGIFSDDFYAAWRATYDESACAPAGGLTESGEMVIGGRTAFVGTCAGGARTYHVRVGDDILVSALAIGSRGLGEELVTGIR